MGSGGSHAVGNRGGGGVISPNRRYYLGKLGFVHGSTRRSGQRGALDGEGSASPRTRGGFGIQAPKPPRAVQFLVPGLLPRCLWRVGDSAHLPVHPPAAACFSSPQALLPQGCACPFLLRPERPARCPWSRRGRQGRAPQACAPPSRVIRPFSFRSESRCWFLPSDQSHRSGLWPPGEPPFLLSTPRRLPAAAPRQRPCRGFPCRLLSLGPLLPLARLPAQFLAESFEMQVLPVMLTAFRGSPWPVCMAEKASVPVGSSGKETPRQSESGEVH